MSVASFCAAMAPYAKQAAAATGLDCRLFLTQWGLESSWGTSALAIADHNFAGIRRSAGKGCTCCAGDGISTVCPNIQDFTNLYIAILEQSYGALLATRGQSLAAQMVALGQSPWDAGHYEGGCGTPGCALINLYNQNAHTIDTCLAKPTGCTPACPPGFTCVAGACVAAPPPPPGSMGGFGTVLLVVAGVALGAAAWEHRERLEALLSTSSGKRARRSGGYV